MSENSKMTDLEITRLCAQAMGYMYDHEREGGPSNPASVFITGRPSGSGYTYYPLDNDGQALALVKKHNLQLLRVGGGWVCLPEGKREGVGRHDLNRAICECVAVMHHASISNRGQP